MTLARKITPTGFPDRVVANPKPREDKVALIRAYLASSFALDRPHRSRRASSDYLNISISDDEWQEALGRRHPKLQ